MHASAGKAPLGKQELKRTALAAAADGFACRSSSHHTRCPVGAVVPHSRVGDVADALQGAGPERELAAGSAAAAAEGGSTTSGHIGRARAGQHGKATGQPL